MWRETNLHSEFTTLKRRYDRNAKFTLFLHTSHFLDQGLLSANQSLVFWGQMHLINTVLIELLLFAVIEQMPYEDEDQEMQLKFLENEAGKWNFSQGLFSQIK